MAFLGKIFIAGTEFLEGKFKSGISFSMLRKAPLKYIHETENGDWQVEFSKNSSEVVARSTSILSFDELQSLGFDTIQLALDILSVKGILSTNLDDPAGSHNGVYCSNGKSIAYTYSLLGFPLNISCSVKHTDSSGKEIKPPQLEPIWNESFRYYRLSQSSTDLFEAYRNLFLAFEALLNKICPKNSGEKERVWLKRSLEVVNSRIKLVDLTPTGSGNPVEYIISSQYINIRCKLQHAKFPQANLPHSHLRPSDVKQAYGDLVRIWRHIAGTYFHVPTGGGLVTYEGFEDMMSKVFTERVTIYYTSDNLKPRKEDTKVSPQGKSFYKFVSSNYRGQIRPGVVRIIAYEDTLTLSEQYKKPIYRVCTKAGSVMYCVDYIEQGLVVSGVDGFECIQEFRLINSSQPNIEFKT